MLWWQVRWTTLGILLWLLWLTFPFESAMADCTTGHSPPTYPSASAPDATIELGPNAEPTMVNTLAIVCVVLAFGIAGLMWVKVDLLHQMQRGERLLALAQLNPSLIERVELHDGEVVFLRLTLKDLRPEAVIGLSPVECVRTFDHLQSMAGATAQCLIVGGPVRIDHEAHEQLN